MRGDVDGYVAEFNPAIPVYRIWYPDWKNVKVWRLVGNGKIVLDQAAPPDVQAGAGHAPERPAADPLVQVKKYQVVRRRVQGMYVAFSDFNTGLRDTVWLSS